MKSSTMVLAAMLLAGITGAATVELAGLRWDVRTGGGGPFGTGLWDDSPDSVCVDGSGALHLRLRNVGGQWYQAEVEARSVGVRGEYRFVVQAGPSVDPLLSPRLEDWDVEAHNVVLGLFLYAYHGGNAASGCPWVPGESAYTCEVDVEVTDAWAWAECENGSTVSEGSSLFFSVQPTCDACGPVPVLSGDLTTHVFDWQPVAVDFESFDGAPCYEGCPTLLAESWPATIPEANLRPILNLWVAGGGDASGLTHDVEVVIPDVELPMLYADGFENGDLCWWSSTLPASSCPPLPAGNVCPGTVR